MRFDVSFYSRGSVFGGLVCLIRQTSSVIPGGKGAYKPRYFDGFPVSELCFFTFSLCLELLDPVTDHRVGGNWLIVDGSVHEFIDLLLGFVEGFVITLFVVN